MPRPTSRGDPSPLAAKKLSATLLAVSTTASLAVTAGCNAAITPMPTLTIPGNPSSLSSKGSPSTPGNAAPEANAPEVQPDPDTTAATGSTDPDNAAPTSVPTPPATGTTGPVTITGTVFADAQQRLGGVTVTATAVGGGTFADGTTTKTTTTDQLGAYAVSGAPSGATIAVTVSKDGYTSRQQTIVPQASNTTLNFGADADGTPNETFAMSDQPEVVSMTPAPNATGVDPATGFTLTWSEPVDTTDVEQAFAIAVSHRDVTLSSGGDQIKLTKVYAPDTDTFDGAATLAAGKAVYDASALSFSWSNNNRTVAITFRPGHQLPTDKDSANVPQYAVGFKQSIRDAAGSGIRSGRFFRTSPAQIGKNGAAFTVAADTTPPRLVAISAIVNGYSANQNAVRFHFSEPMVLTPGTLGDSIPKAASPASARHTDRYRLHIGASAPDTWLLAPTSHSARLYAGDATNATIEVTHDPKTAIVHFAGDLDDPIQVIDFRIDNYVPLRLQAVPNDHATTMYALKVLIEGHGGPQDNYAVNASGHTLVITDGAGQYAHVKDVRIAGVTVENGPAPTWVSTADFVHGATVWGTADGSIEDPAGNKLVTSNGANISSATAI